VVLVHLGGTLEKTRVEIEDITGVSLTTWGTSEKQGHLTVSDSLLGEIVIDDETVHAVVTEVLTDSAA
jgi:ATP-dependent Clp protease ATP-binding subunit ClpA